MKKVSKKQRQTQILRIVNEETIETQTDLVLALRQSGVDVTQATVSRDIKELGIVKVMSGRGMQRYVALSRGDNVTLGRLKRVFAEAVVSIRRADAFVFIKTLPGLAQGAASALDAMYFDEVLGTLAGDDTIFVGMADDRAAENLCEKLQTLTKQEPDSVEPDATLEEES